MRRPTEKEPVVEGLRELIDLQKLDDDLHVAEAEWGRLPDRRAKLASEREEAAAKVAAGREALQAAEADLRGAESEVQDKEALLQKLEGQQFQVKSNEAYTALLSEMEQAREAISECETRILEAMEAIETAREEFVGAEQEQEAVVGRATAGEKALDGREKELDARLAELRGARGTLLGQVDADLRRHYERAAARHRPAVAHVRRGICQGCRVSVPAQLQIELMRGERLITCNSCQRILIAENGLDDAAK